MKDYTGFSDEAQDAILAKKIEIGIGHVNEQIELAYREAIQGEEGSEEDIDSEVNVPEAKKPRKVVITDDEQHAEQEYEVKLQKRRLFDAVCKADLDPVMKLKVFRALTE